MKLFLVRHGQSVANLENTYAGQMDIPLTDLGRQQALDAGHRLKNVNFDAVFSSDLSRAAETCAIALPGSDPEITPLLREYAIGTVQGHKISDVKVPLPEDPQRAPDYTPYGGEDALMVRARARTFLNLLEERDCEYVAAFTHRGFMNSLLREVLGTTFKSGSIRTKIVRSMYLSMMAICGNCWRSIICQNFKKTDTGFA